MMVNPYDNNQTNLIQKCIEFKNGLKISQYNWVSINGYLQLTTKRAAVKNYIYDHGAPDGSNHEGSYQII